MAVAQNSTQVARQTYQVDANIVQFGEELYSLSAQFRIR